jgi:predicted ATPase/DNA-binding winged helix-turn-helix (wHTH) protein
LNRSSVKAVGATEVICFGPFSLHRATRVLLEHGQPVRLGNRALDILLVLVERAGEFVSNDEISRHVWPRTVVVEANLRVHIVGLRKALGDGRDGRRFIVNVPNRGYSFVAPLHAAASHVDASTAASPAPLAGIRPPAPLGRIVGQDAAIRVLFDQLLQRRLVTVVGPGGIGKTTVALAAVADATNDAAPARWTTAHFVDLGSLSEGDKVPASLASALGLGALMGEALQRLLAFLHDKKLLIVFDSCEHLVSSVAPLVEGILRGAPGVRVLATSREPLGAEGEWVHRLQPLALPPANSRPSASEVLRYGAVELFVERCSGALDPRVMTDAEANIAVDLCRRLDGIPLAIELAAARMGALGLRGVAAGLDSRLMLSSKGRRTAVPRQQTLRATLDWSFDLLTPTEQRVLSRLSLFAGAFTLDAATELAGDDTVDADAVEEAVSELVAKSLIVSDVTGDEAIFRLLDMTRAYGLDRLAPHPQELAGLRRRHAQACLALLMRAEAAWTWMPTRDFVAKFRSSIDDIRAALNWALAPDGDGRLGVELTVRATPLFFQLSSTDEHRQYIEKALTVAASGIDRRQELELAVISAHAIFSALGLHPDRDRAFARASALAEQIGDQRLLALTRATQWMSAYQESNPKAMLEYAQQYVALTAESADPALTLHRDRMMALTLHLLGDQEGSRACCERSLSIHTVIRAPYLVGTRIDRRVVVGCTYARVLWLLGQPDQAEEAIQQALDRAAEEGEPIGLVNALALGASPLALWEGRAELARERVDRLLRHAAERALTAWRIYGLAYRPYIQWLESGASGVPPRLEMPPTTPLQLSVLMATLHPSYLTQTVIDHGNAGLAGWCQAELLRARGEQLQSTDPETAELLFQSALDQAMQDGTVPWALRAATSLARLWLRQGKTRAATSTLDRVLPLVPEGSTMREAMTARTLRRRESISERGSQPHFHDRPSSSDPGELS